MSSQNGVAPNAALETDGNCCPIRSAAIPNSAIPKQPAVKYRFSIRLKMFLISFIYGVS